MLKVLHCFSDQIHSDYCIDVFEDYRNIAIEDYVVVCDYNTKFKYIKNNSEKIKRISPNDIITSINASNYDAVFLHSLNVLPYTQLYRIKKTTKIFWFAWGFDIYSYEYYRPFVKLPLYRQMTRKAMSQGLINRLRVLHGHFVLWQQRKEIERSIARIDYFSGVLPEEYDLMAENVFFKAKRVNYSYFKKPASNAIVSYKDVCGNDILVGNSGDPTNNHIDAYKELQSLDLGEKKVYSFLSYGGTTDYLKRVVDAGLKILGAKYQPIIDFLPFEEFERVIQNCGNVIMYHERQQALGNVYQAIGSGCKVYFSETSVTYKSLKNMGYIIFTVQHDLNEDRFNTPLSQNEIKHNRECLQKYVSPQVSYKKIDRIFEIIKSE